jgi:hypothetical protein
MENNLLQNKITSEGIAETYSGDGYIRLHVHSPIVDKSLIEGKYSSAFVEELRRQISLAIERELLVGNIDASSLELYLVFAPGTYMEHIVDGTTYRRLLITARACSARDLWIKWRSLKSDETLSVSSEASGDDVIFELGEDVPQKIREKEYRFLVRTSPSEYQLSMGRKNITAWRDIIKREIKRGALTRSEALDTEATASVSEPELTVESRVQPDSDELTAKIQQALSTYSAPQDTVTEPTVSEEINSDINAMLKNLLGVTESKPMTEAEPQQTPITVPESDSMEEEFVIEDEPELSDEPVSEEEAVSEEAVTEEDEREQVAAALDLEESLRLKIEAELREKYEREARERIEAETEKYRTAREELLRENARLADLARRTEEEKRLESERFKSEIEARDNAEKRERERVAELARLALIEEQRLEAERIARESRVETEPRVEATAAVAEPVVSAPAPVKVESETKNYKYITKNARLLFRRPVDPAITKRIHEIILTTIKYFHKEDVYIKIKATIPDLTTVNLEFVKIPEEETELLINIIKVLGKSDLGIFKVYLE